MARKNFGQCSPKASLEEYDKFRSTVVLNINQMEHAGYGWSIAYSPVFGYFLRFAVLFRDIDKAQATRAANDLKFLWIRRLTSLRGSAHFSVREFAASVDLNNINLESNSNGAALRDSAISPSLITHFLIPQRTPFFLKPVSGMRFCDRSRAPYRSMKKQSAASINTH